MKNQYAPSDVRQEVLRTLFSTTLAVMLLLVIAGLLMRAAPTLLRMRLDRALSAGDTASARLLAEKLDDETERSLSLQQCSYMDGLALMQQGALAEAAEAFSTAGEYEDAQTLYKRCLYEQAEALFAQGAFTDAEALYRSLGGFSDAADKVTACRYSEAVLLEEQGELPAAAAAFAKLGSYKDAASRYEALAQELGGTDDSSQALSLTREPSEEQTQLGALRASLPQGIIDVGFLHTVGLAADGRVYACGDDSFGQCQVGSWRDAVAVAAGAYHTAALLKDGHVVCTGRNTEGQCDTGDWTDIVQIAASDYNTIGLRADGTLVWTGFVDLWLTEDWTRLTGLCAGSYNIGAKRADGSLWFYPDMLNEEQLDGAVQLAVNTGYAVGVTENGDVLCSFVELPWHDVLSVSAGSTAILGLGKDGQVLSYFFRESDRLDFSGLTDVVALAAGGTHSAFVLSDGSVVVLGQRDSGQGDTESWRLAVG